MAKVLSVGLSDVVHAREYYEKAARISTKIYQMTQCSAGEYIMDYASYFDLIEDFEQAERLLEKCKSDSQKATGGTYHTYYGIICCSLGNVRKGQQRFVEAQASVEQGYQIQKQFYQSENHPEVATALYCKAMILMAQEKYEEALYILQQQIEIDKNGICNSQTKVSRDYLELARVQFIVEQEEEAYQSISNSLALEIALYGEESPRTARRYLDIGLLILDFNSTEAGEYLTKAMNLQKKLFDENSPYLLPYYRAIGQYYCQTENLTRCLQFYKQALSIDISTKDAPTLQKEDLLLKLADIYDANDNFAECVRCYRSAMNVCVAIKGELSYSYGWIAQKYSSMLKRIFGQQRQAIYYSKVAYEILRNYPQDEQYAKEYYVLTRGSLLFSLGDFVGSKKDHLRSSEKSAEWKTVLGIMEANKEKYEYHDLDRVY